MKKLISILFILSLVACSKDKSTSESNQQIKDANVFFTATDDLTTSISAAQQTNPQDLTPNQKQIVEKLKACTVSQNTANSVTNTTISGDACPVVYMQQTQMADSEMKTDGNLAVNDAQFEKLVGFNYMKTTSALKIISNDQGQQTSLNTKADFDSTKWKKGIAVTAASFNGQYVGDKNHMNFTMNFSQAVQSETINISMTLSATGAAVTDQNGNTNSQITSAQCTLNGSSIDCKQLIGSKKNISKKSQQLMVKNF